MIPVKSSMSMPELMALFKQPPVDAGAIMSLTPDVSVWPREDSPLGVLPDLYQGLLYDDCESSMELARLAKKASLAMFQRLNQQQGPQGARADGLKKGCEGWRILSKFTDVSWGLMVRIFDRANAMLSAGHLKIMTGVGLATNASADEEKADTAEYCGHCFNVGILQTPSMPSPYPFLLEGTAPMYQIKVTDKSPRVTVHLFEDWDSSKPPAVKVLNMAEFLSALSGEIMALSQVINKPNGMVERKGGWPLDVGINGWLAKTMVMSSLDSDPDTHLSFYHRLVYMGLPCTAGGLGCMPVHEDPAKNEAAAGCHPFDLANVQLRALDASMPGDSVRLMTDIMNETAPPMADPSVIQQLALNWIPCRPLEEVNTADNKAGKYHRVVAMESPCAPEYLAIIHEAKRRLVDETNKINRACVNSDGIILTAMIEGLSALVCADVPDESIPNLTVIRSMRAALGNVKWNGFVPKEDKAPLLKKGVIQEEHPWKTDGTSRHASIQTRRSERTSHRQSSRASHL